jgi:anaerobic ribonucleoside-triphosphate reductase activating protein
MPGCGRNCEGCHNKWTHDYSLGHDFTWDDFDGLCQILDKDYIAGLTISGGDPLMQNDDVLIDLLQLVHDIKDRYPNKPIWIYTGYYVNELKGLQLDILNYCDVVVEGPFDINKKDTTLPFRGSNNQRIVKLN